MCGITGFLTTKQPNKETLQSLIQRMTETLRHRGPDGEGFWIDLNAGIAFGHRRLSILDLSEAGKQPMLSSCERFILTFNGEIYNHKELKQELEKAQKAPFFRGTSDTEILLAAISAWGLAKTLQRSNGMFALALWDRKTSQLFLARDRLGIKPLYYGWTPSAFVFGSELNPVALYPDFDPHIDQEAIAHYLRVGNIPAPRSIYKNVRKLLPGQILRIDDPQNRKIFFLDCR